MRRLFPVRTVRLQLCCETLPSFASRVDVSYVANAMQLRDTQAGSKRALPRNGSYLWSRLMLWKERAGQYRAALPGKPGLVPCGAVLFRCSMSPGKDPGVVSKPSTEGWEGRQTQPIPSWLPMALGSQTELLGFTGCLVKGSAQ